MILNYCDWSNLIGAVYIENDTELFWQIRLGVDYEKKN